MGEIKHIPIAYATANDYEHTIVSMLSVLENLSIEEYYDFYILVDNDFSDNRKREFINCFKGYEAFCNISFKNVGNVFENVYLRIESIGKPTYFRLLLPVLLQEKKCIYLDSDTIICENIQKLLKFDLQDCYVAGVKAPWYVLKADVSYSRQALLPDMGQYINAGVLLMNLSEMRKDNIVEKMLGLLPYNMDSQDQDIINSACYGRIKFLPFGYNVMTKYAAWPLREYGGLFSENELKTAWNNPQIIHYADRIKPWDSLDCAMGDYWWSVCRRSCMWDYFYKRIEGIFFSKMIYHVDENNITTKRTFVLFDLLSKKNLFVYGAGNRSKQLVNYLKVYNIRPEVILISDKKNNPDEVEGIRVKELKELEGKYMDKTVIIATLEKYHMEIIAQLYQYGFREIIPLSDQWE